MALRVEGRRRAGPSGQWIGLIIVTGSPPGSLHIVVVVVHVPLSGHFLIGGEFLGSHIPMRLPLHIKDMEWATGSSRVEPGRQVVRM